MNQLKIHTVPTAEQNQFTIYWTNTPGRRFSIIKVRLTTNMQDAVVAAELAALQHLLEEREVLGKNPVGNSNMKLTVTFGAIRKLMRQQSDKSHLAPYAGFLATRFAGCALGVDKDTRWFDGQEPEMVENLVVQGPQRETLQIAGMEVAVTRHVLKRFATRFLPEMPPSAAAHVAWKKLNVIAGDQKIREVARSSLWHGLASAAHGKHAVRYFLHEERKLILVITDNPGEGMRLVTTYQANHQFQNMPLAA